MEGESEDVVCLITNTQQIPYSLWPRDFDSDAIVKYKPDTFHRKPNTQPAILLKLWEDVGLIVCYVGRTT